MAKKSPAAAAAATATPSTALVQESPEVRAERALAFESTRTQLQALAKQSTSLTRVDTQDNFDAAKAAKAKLASTRVAIEKTGKAAREDATKYGKAVIAKERELLQEIQPEEARLGALIDAEQRKRDDAERAIREEQAKRAAAIEAAFTRVRMLPELARAGGATLESIDALIAEGEKLRDDHSHLPEELHPAALYEARLAVNGCKAARDALVKHQADLAELEQLRAERAAREQAEERARANAAEAERAARVIADNAARAQSSIDPAPVDLDDDLPPGVSAGATLAPLSHRGGSAVMPADDDDLPPGVPATARRVVPLLQAAVAALELMRQRGLEANSAYLDLRDAVALERSGGR